ncbi:XisI protein [Chamaesiphon sp. VAR_69_metabat_338]|uniref:XisI protein n=1 Tax=Chamaesiphon sp. VAR_69_metabat_338 TaxID=2964704 RepID=UPI00286E1EB3|nr:XisI protein [Chamaesiphon sp. VAR_69_metabat_338]
MDRPDFYRKCLQEFLNNYSSYGSKHLDIETQLIFDTVNERYLLFRTGWDNQRRIHNCIFHFDIKGDKIWIQENNTDIEVDKALEEMGISKKEIVVGFHHPSMREYSEYAVS